MAGRIDPGDYFHSTYAVLAALLLDPGIVLTLVLASNGTGRDDR